MHKFDSFFLLPFHCKTIHTNTFLYLTCRKPVHFLVLEEFSKEWQVLLMYRVCALRARDSHILCWKLSTEKQFTWKWCLVLQWVAKHTMRMPVLKTWVFWGVNNWRTGPVLSYKDWWGQHNKKNNKEKLQKWSFLLLWELQPALGVEAVSSKSSLTTLFS